MRGMVPLLLAATLSPCALAQEVDSKVRREGFAAQAVGLNFAFLEAQRSGLEPADGGQLFPQVWDSANGFKQPAFTDQCSSVLEELSAGDAQTSNLAKYGGYFEAGTSVTVTGTSAFVAVQRAIGAMHFMDEMSNFTPAGGPVRHDGCMQGGYMTTTLKDLYLREMRFSAESLAASILVSREDHSEFKLLVGVADSTTFNERTTWGALDSYSQKCYIGDDAKPAADIAAQVSAALAIMSRVARDHGTSADSAAAARWETLAKRAYVYAQDQYSALFGAATCTAAAADNCEGSGCSGGSGTCSLYRNTKDARQQLFVAAAALHISSTGSTQEKNDYRADADEYWDDGWEPFFFNWNNVAPQGIMLLAAAPNFNGVRRNKDFYKKLLLKGVKQWETCSNDGSAVFGDGKVFCERTADGGAYPLDIPQGQIGQGLNGICLTAVASKLGLLTSTFKRQAHCFMQRQLGYMYNHKCADNAEHGDSSCNTDDSEGFSYIVGMGEHYPDRLHSRDAAFPNWRAGDGTPDGNRLCGASVTGPYLGEGRNNDPDRYLNSRSFWRESEPGIDFTASTICGLMGYASLPENSFEHCRVRTPFTGRTGGVTSPNPPGGNPPPLPPVRDPIDDGTVECAGLHQQCGGQNFAGAECCVGDLVCNVQNIWYSQCDPPAADEEEDAPPPVDEEEDAPPPVDEEEEVEEEEEEEPIDPTECVAAYEQCDGVDFGGPRCCPDGYECVGQDIWYSQCRKIEDVPDDAEDEPEEEGEPEEEVDDPVDPVDDVVAIWQQCGGNNYDGPAVCAAGLMCFEQSEWYSQCIPA